MLTAVQHPSPTQLNSHQCMKLLALVLMTIDHVGAYLYPDMLWLRAAGRLCVPIWFFLIGHAPYYTIKRDTILWAVALAVLNPFLGPSVFALNVLFTILLCQYVLRIIEKKHMLVQHPFFLCFVCILFLPPSMVLMEYGTQGVMYALMGYAVRSGQMNWRTGKLVSVVALMMYVLTQSVMLPFSVAQIAFMAVGCSLLTLYLTQFVWRPVCSELAPVVSRPLVWLSRHSLQYYVVHRVLLEALGLVWGVSAFYFHWVEL